MPVPKEELVKDLDTPEYQTLITAELAKRKFIVRDEAAETSFKTLYAKEITDKTTHEIHTRYDNDLKEVFGDSYKRNDNERTYEALKRVGKDVLKQRQDKIDELNEAIKKGDSSGALKKQLEEAQNQYKTKVDELTGELTKYKSTAEGANKQALLNSDYEKVSRQFVKALPPLFDQTKKFILDGVIGSAVVKDGVLYVGENGVIKRDGQFHEIKVEDHLKTLFKDVIDTRKPAGGSGSGSDDDAGKKVDPSTFKKETYTRNPDVKTVPQFVDQMLADGLVQGTKLFMEIYTHNVDTKTGQFKPQTS